MLALVISSELSHAEGYSIHVSCSWQLALGRAQKRQGSTTEGEARDGSYAGERPENAPKMSGPKGLSKTQQVLSDFLHKNFFAWQENSKSEIAKETAR